MAALMIGSTGKSVEQFKALLNLATNAKLIVNQQFDSAMESAVKQFQKAARLPQTGRIDAATATAIEKKATESLTKQFHKPRAIPKWLKLANDEVGTKELPGYSRNNPRILEYWRTCPYMVNATSGPFYDSTRNRAKGLFDETSWCGAFVTWVMVKAGFVRSHLPYYGSNALAWATWGVPATTPTKDGAIVVVRDVNNNDPHVGFYSGAGSGRLFILGGNQREPSVPVTREANGIMVSEVDYTGMFNVVAYRWPSTNIIPESCQAPVLVDALWNEVRPAAKTA